MPATGGEWSFVVLALLATGGASVTAGAALRFQKQHGRVRPILSAPSQTNSKSREEIHK